MFPHNSHSFSSSRSPLIPWLVAGLMALALAPATAGAMPGREQQAQPVQQAQPASSTPIGDTKYDLAPAQVARVYGSHGPLHTSGPLPMAHSVQSPAVSSASSGDGTDTWLIAGIGAALLAACAAGIGVARKTRVRAVRHA